MNENRLNKLIYILLILETTMIVLSYFNYIGWISICIGGIYLLTALSDLWSKGNVQITRLLLILSLLISLPRIIIQTQEVIHKEKQAELIYLDSIPKPIRREVRVELFDCSRIPIWQGELQMKCNISNLEQRKLQNQIEESYSLALREYESDIQERKNQIMITNLRYLSPKSISIILLYVLINPIIPLLVIFLVHKDKGYIANVITLQPSEIPYTPIETLDIGKNRKIIAKKLFISGFKMEEIQGEVGVSRATLYRWRKELDFNGI